MDKPGCRATGDLETGTRESLGPVGLRRAAGPARGGVAAVLFAGLLFPAAAAAQRSTEVLVDRVAVVVEGSTSRDRDPQLATLWDLYVAAAIDVVRRGGPEAFSLPIDLDAVRAAQARAAEDLVALREATRMGRGELAPGLVDEARDRLAERIGGHDALRAFLRERAVSMESVDEALRRELIVERFTRDSVHPPAAADAAELEALFAAGDHPFVGSAYADVAAEFEAWERQQRFSEFRARWLMDLRSRCRLQVYEVTEDLALAEGGP
ncbi:MAG: hypothetical protein HY905_10095 [Deltaproteobacteria bacterium]|nr:hypothetical protein [Deltaproteobacteria bacterium]